MEEQNANDEIQRDLEMFTYDELTLEAEIFLRHKLSEKLSDMLTLSDMLSQDECDEPPCGTITYSMVLDEVAPSSSEQTYVDICSGCIRGWLRNGKTTTMNGIPEDVEIVGMMLLPMRDAVRVFFSRPIDPNIEYTRGDLDGDH